MLTAQPSSQPSAVVLGGGLAGLSAAVRLAEADWKVHVIETRRVLGGRATSFTDPATGEPFDNCQHVLLGCCTNLLDFYRRLGVLECIGWADRLFFADKQGRVDVLEAVDLPAPLHLGPALARFRTLGWRDKLAIGRAMAAICRMGRAGRQRYTQMTFADWLARQGQTRRAIERFWSVIAISACNLSPDRLGADHGLQVFQEGFLGHARAYRMGTSTVPLVALYGQAGRWIAQAGGEILQGCSVRSLDFQAGQVTGVTLADGRTLQADRYISALPYDRLARIAPRELVQADARLQSLDRIEASPIIGIHLWFDRPVTDRPHLIFVDSPLQWIFNKGSAEAAPTGQYLHAVVSAADAWVDHPAEVIIAMATEELSAYESAVRRATLVRGRVIKEKRATFAAVAGVNALRPDTGGAVENLLLAGDWCATGWPATMEGAVRSGYAAAGAATGRNLRIADLPASSLYRWLSGEGEDEEGPAGR